MSINPAWSSVVSDLFVNLSAGWFGAAFIVPNFSNVKGAKRLVMLTGDLVFAIVSLLIASWLRL